MNSKHSLVALIAFKTVIASKIARRASVHSELLIKKFPFHLDFWVILPASESSQFSRLSTKRGDYPLLFRLPMLRFFQQLSAVHFLCFFTVQWISKSERVVLPTVTNSSRIWKNLAPDNAASSRKNLTMLFFTSRNVSVVLFLKRDPKRAQF